MKTAFSLAVLALVLAAPGRCFALTWGGTVTKEQAKEMGIEVRSTGLGANQVRVELEFKADGPLKDSSRVELCFGDEDKPRLTAPLQEDRSKPGRIVVSFTADRAHLDKIDLRVVVPGPLGRGIYRLPVKDFVELKKDG